MAHHAKLHEDADIGSFEDLLARISAPFDPEKPLAGSAFFATPAQFLEFFAMVTADDDDVEDPDADAGPLDADDRAVKMPLMEYIDGIVVFKSRGNAIHNAVAQFFMGSILKGLQKWSNQAQIGHLVEDLLPMFSRVSDLEPDSPCYMEPDVAFGEETMRANVIPTLVVEVSYAHRFTRQGLEDRYKSYFARTEGKTKVIICVDIYYGHDSYGHDSNRIHQTIENLDRSAISVWALGNDGQVRTLVNWAPLS